MYSGLADTDHVLIMRSVCLHYGSDFACGRYYSLWVDIARGACTLWPLSVSRTCVIWSAVLFMRVPVKEQPMAGFLSADSQALQSH